MLRDPRFGTRLDAAVTWCWMTVACAAAASPTMLAVLEDAPSSASLYLLLATILVPQLRNGFAKDLAATDILWYRLGIASSHQHAHHLLRVSRGEMEKPDPRCPLLQAETCWCECNLPRHARSVEIVCCSRSMEVPRRQRFVGVHRRAGRRQLQPNG